MAQDACILEIQRLISLHAFWVIDSRFRGRSISNFENEANIRVRDICGLVSAFDQTTNEFTVELIRDIPEIASSDNAGFSAYGEYSNSGDKVILPERFSISVLVIYPRINEGVNTEHIDETDRRDSLKVVRAVSCDCER